MLFGFGVIALPLIAFDRVGNQFDIRRENLITGQWSSAIDPDPDPLNLKPDHHFQMGKVAGDWSVDGSRLILESDALNHNIELDISPKNDQLTNDGGWHLVRTKSR